MNITLLLLSLLEVVARPDLVLGNALTNRVDVAVARSPVVYCRLSRRGRILRGRVQVTRLDVSEEFEEYP